MRAAVLSGVLWALFSGSSLAEDLNLVCAGTGRFPQGQSQSVTIFDANTGNYSTGNVTSTTSQSVNAVVRFELRTSSARILMPPAMTPPINRGSDGGWWALDRLNVEDNEIAGRFILNTFNRPEITIDRLNGTIEVDGNFGYYFLGQCEIDTSATERRF